MLFNIFLHTRDYATGDEKSVQIAVRMGPEPSMVKVKLRSVLLLREAFHLTLLFFFHGDIHYLVPRAQGVNIFWS